MKPNLKKPALAVPVILALSSCAVHEPVQDESACEVERSLAHEQLIGTLWVQTSAEYELLTASIFERAKAQLLIAKADPDWSAALEQTGHFADKPPAVILDVDETVLDNSPYQAQLVLDGGLYASDTWREWVDLAQADWVPGAKTFLEFAESEGVEVFLVTNRDAEEEAATRKNFEALGYALAADHDNLLTKNEQPGWTSDKTSRRSFVAEDYRILLLVGDDLNDFTAARGSRDERLAATSPHRDRIGERWILIPNPLYGSWERALFDFGDDCDMLEEKRGHLRGYRD